MSVLVTMQVGPVDWGKFRSAVEWLKEQEAPGLRSSNIYRSDNEPATVLVVEEWDSHDAWHKFAERVGEEFNKRSGGEELDWQDNVWNASDAPSRG
jgi:heme-degrading monooxygenase HmoA